MPRKSKKTDDATPTPKTATGDAVVLPSKAKRSTVSAGVARPARAGGRKVTASIAASASKLFPKGGAAFAAWLGKLGVKPEERRTAEEWADLLQQFASRPIHGHRRGKRGGNHRPSGV